MPENQKIIISDYEGDTTIKFGGDMTVQIVQNGNIINGKYTVHKIDGDDSLEAKCTWDSGVTDVFVKDYEKLYNKESARNHENKTFGIYELQGNQLNYKNGNHKLYINVESISISE